MDIRPAVGSSILERILRVHEFTLSSRTARQTCDAMVTGQDPVETTCEGARLIAHSLRLYETPNLQLIQARIGLKMPAANVVRCFNVLGFFDAAFGGTRRSSSAITARRTLVRRFPRERQTPEALGALVKADAEKWWPIIKDSGIKAE
jgi:hypothetical protein